MHCVARCCFALHARHLSMSKLWHAQEHLKSTYMYKRKRFSSTLRPALHVATSHKILRPPPRVLQGLPLLSQTIQTCPACACREGCSCNAGKSTAEERRH